LAAILASIPVALPATFTLAAAVGARALATVGVLPTRLSTLDEAASMDVLCSDKTGTLTNNELTVTAIHAIPGFDESRLLGFAALASSERGADPVDGAIRAAERDRVSDRPAVLRQWLGPETASLCQRPVLRHGGSRWIQLMTVRSSASLRAVR
jgi:H+-transporting ATPase